MIYITKEEIPVLKNGITIKIREYDYLNVVFRMNLLSYQLRIRKYIKPMFLFTKLG